MIIVTSGLLLTVGVPLLVVFACMHRSKWSSKHNVRHRATLLEIQLQVPLNSLMDMDYNKLKNKLRDLEELCADRHYV